jgi:hypothetical protein
MSWQSILKQENFLLDALKQEGALPDMCPEGLEHLNKFFQKNTDGFSGHRTQYLSHILGWMFDLRWFKMDSMALHEMEEVDKLKPKVEKVFADAKMICSRQQTYSADLNFSGNNE